jgi:hypothetical protein
MAARFAAIQAHDNPGMPGLLNLRDNTGRNIAAAAASD